MRLFYPVAAVNARPTAAGTDKNRKVRRNSLFPCKSYRSCPKQSSSCFVVKSPIKVCHSRTVIEQSINLFFMRHTAIMLMQQSICFLKQLDIQHEHMEWNAPYITIRILPKEMVFVIFMVICLTLHPFSIANPRLSHTRVAS